MLTFLEYRITLTSMKIKNAQGKYEQQYPSNRK